MSMNEVAAKIEKLLRMADGTANENESALALLMAQKLADAHNLDIDTIGKSGAREDAQISKGMYQYQRDLFQTVANLNHCWCWVAPRVGHGKPSIRLLGSRVNVTVVKNMCSYIEDVTNRLVRENYPWKQFLSRNAHHFREGVIDRMLERVRSKRAEEERERERRRQEEQAAHPGSATAIVLISDVAREEEKANYDYLHGEGAWDARQASIQEARRRREQAEEEFEQWKLDHPEEWAKREAERQKAWEEEEKRWERNRRARERAQEKREREGRSSYTYRKPTKWDSEHYHAGRTEGDSISLSDQIDKHGKSKGNLPEGE